MGPILESLPHDWEVILWDNGSKTVQRRTPSPETINPLLRTSLIAPDLSVYGRYAAIEHATGDLIYVQDDDVIVSDPQAIVEAWLEHWISMQPDDEGSLYDHSLELGDVPFVVSNMPPEFRHDGYTDSCLVGFGACFHRDAPARAFERFAPAYQPNTSPDWWVEIPLFRRTCDVVFTTLTPRVLVDVPKANLPWAEDASRMYRQPGHVEERQRMLELARQVRDA